MESFSVDIIKFSLRYPTINNCLDITVIGQCAGRESKVFSKYNPEARGAMGTAIPNNLDKQPTIRYERHRQN